MNKRHWNTVMIDGSLSDEFIYSWINASYQLVVEKLPKRLRTELDKN